MANSSERRGREGVRSRGGGGVSGGGVRGGVVRGGVGRGEGGARDRGIGVTTVRGGLVVART